MGIGNYRVKIHLSSKISSVLIARYIDTITPKISAVNRKRSRVIKMAANQPAAKFENTEEKTLNCGGRSSKENLIMIILTHIVEYKVMLVDTHAHLNFPDFEKDLEEVVKRSIRAGVEKIICVSSNIADSERAIEIARKYPKIVFASVGIHPQQTDPENKTSLINQIKELEKLAGQKEVVAIGECGLDFSLAPPGEKDRTHEDQIYLFKEQIKLTQKLNLPVLIHSREVFQETVESLREFKGLKSLKGVFHCYAGGKRGIAKVNELGFYFGVDGNLTYDEGLQNVFKLIPLERIIIETDAPFLTPIPFRGQRNEPAQVKIIAELLAKLKGVTFDKIAQETTENAQKLFASI